MPEKSKFAYDAEDAAGIIIHPEDDERLPLPDASRSLASNSMCVERHAMLGRQHMLPLNALVAKLRESDRGYVPDFDPLDGGTNARLLFLLENPKPLG